MAGKLEFLEKENKIVIRGLKEGGYALTLNKYKTLIKIDVYAGEYWLNNSQNMIKTATALHEDNLTSSQLLISSIDHHYDQKTSNKLSLKIDGKITKHTRVTLLAYEFMPDRVSQI